MNQARLVRRQRVGLGPVILLVVLIVIACYVVFASGVNTGGYGDFLERCFGATGFAAVALAGLCWVGHQVWKVREDFDVRRGLAYCAAAGYGIVLGLALLSMVLD